MSNRIKKVLILGSLLIIFTIIYILTFHFKFTKFINIYSYNGILNLFLISVIFSIILILLLKFHKFNIDFKDCLITILLFSSTHLFFFCLVPVTIERSISVYLLNELNKEALTKDDFEQKFIEKYVYENDAVGKRLDEQIYTGTITSNKRHEYSLNKKGQVFYNLFKWINKIYHVNSNVLT